MKGGKCSEEQLKRILDQCNCVDDQSTEVEDYDDVEEECEESEDEELEEEKEDIMIKGIGTPDERVKFSI